MHDLVLVPIELSIPTKVQPQPHTYPQVLQPTLLGTREDDETTLPLLNTGPSREALFTSRHTVLVQVADFA